MLNKALVFLFALGLTFTLNGCSSSSSDSDKKEAAAETDLDAIDQAGGDMAETGTTQPEGDVLADLGDDAGKSDMKTDEAIDSALPEEAPAPAPTESITESPSVPSEPAASASSGSDDLFGGGGATAATTDDTAPKPVASLKKVKAAPFKQGGVLANTVYIARDGDNMDSVAQKTGASAKDLKKVNSFLSRGVKVGDKIYYNSAKRPTDADRMLTYYEDNGIPEQLYTSKAGENIKDVAKNLLGHKDSWKELWATNAVESKGALDEGTSLRYWPSGAVEAPNMAANEPPPIQEPTAELPPPPAPDAAAAAAIAPPPPAEPPPAAMPEPPPAAKPPKLAKKSDGFLIPGLGQDETFAVGGLALLGVLLGAFIMIRKSKAKKLSSQTQTQI